MAGTSTLTATRDKNIEANTNGRHQILFGKITVTAGGSNTDYATNGLTLDLSGIGPFTEPPIEVKVWSDAVANGFIFRYVPDASPTISNGKVAIFQGTATAVPFAQIAATTLPAAIGATSADTVGALRFRATFIHGR
jgi:hypothetical protein